MADKAPPDKVPIFDFLVVRAPDVVPPAVLRRSYIQDDSIVTVAGSASRVDADLFSFTSQSQVARRVYRHVFCTPEPGEDPLDDLLQDLLRLLGPRVPLCVYDDDANGDAPEDSTNGGGTRVAVAGTATATATLAPAKTLVQPLVVEQLDRRVFVRSGPYYYVLPDRLEQVTSAALVRHVAAALPIIETERKTLDRARLTRRLEGLFDDTPLHKVLFDGGGHSGAYRDAKRALFDTLYLLYVLRRWAGINLGPIMDGLRVLHLLEALAIDRLYDTARAGQSGQFERELVAALRELVPEFRRWDLKRPLPGLPLIADAQALAAYMTATPIVHALFARLFAYVKPFNPIAPLGVGDLKVVKQWLVAYRPGEICDVHNVMKGETKERTHRRLEKTEETFAFSSSQEEESTKDTQSTDRFELKREAEQVLKSDLNVNANTSFRYDNKVILATVGAGFAYNRADSQTNKMAQNFSHDVVSKAVTRVESRTSQQRSVTKIFETEETNKHSFTATGEHISGIYRWIDKRYKAQLYNYGKRMMFEFVVPEPAAFFVESRLRAFESSLEYPQPPKAPTYKSLSLGFTSAQINATKFAELREKYDLAAFTFPLPKRDAVLVDQESQQAYLSERDRPKLETRYAKSHTCRLNQPGYQIDRLRVQGDLWFHNRNEADPWNRNTFAIQLNGAGVPFNTGNLEPAKYHSIDVSLTPAGGSYLLTGDTVDLVLLFQDIWRYALVVSVELSLSAAALQKWQLDVHNAVAKQANERIAEENRELKLAYESQLAAYRNRIAELRATAINDLVQGRSEAFNRETILTELRRQCLALLAKEFDADSSDDILTDLETMAGRNVEYLATRLNVKEADKTTVGFETSTVAVQYPVIKLDRARSKGRYIQFLEQAFEWRQLAYQFYPYFWSTPPHWVQLLSRSDTTDPNFTAFLEAGAARILVAVTPAYDDAVLHFLATREPWEGGSVPVIGDPLYLPLHEELRKQQDDLYGATPEGDPWEFTLPTSLVYIHGSSTPLPDLAAERPPGP